MPPRRQFQSADEILRYKEEQRLKHRESAFNSRHRTEFNQARLLAQAYQRQLVDTPDDITLLTKIQYWREKSALHLHALTTGKRIRPRITLTAEEQHYIETELRDHINRHGAEHEADLRAIADTTEQKVKQAALERGLNSEEDMNQENWIRDFTDIPGLDDVLGIKKETDQ